jgi:hypothetical protein
MNNDRESSYGSDKKTVVSYEENTEIKTIKKESHSTG